jgi:hypothetical protein
MEDEFKGWPQSWWLLEDRGKAKLLRNKLLSDSRTPELKRKIIDSHDVSPKTKFNRELVGYRPGG